MQPSLQSESAVQHESFLQHCRPEEPKGPPPPHVFPDKVQQVFTNNNVPKAAPITPPWRRPDPKQPLTDPSTMAYETLNNIADELQLPYRARQPKARPRQPKSLPVLRGTAPPSAPGSSTDSPGFSKAGMAQLYQQQVRAIATPHKLNIEVDSQQDAATKVLAQEVQRLQKDIDQLVSQPQQAATIAETILKREIQRLTKEIEVIKAQAQAQSSSASGGSLAPASERGSACIQQDLGLQ